MINTDVIEKVNAQFRLLITQIEDGKAEIKRLRALVKEAYEEGWDSARYGSRTDNDNWLTSSTRAALQPKEENQ